MIRPRSFNGELRQQTHLSANTQLNCTVGGPALRLLQNQRIIALMMRLCACQGLRMMSAQLSICLREGGGGKRPIIDDNCAPLVLRFQNGPLRRRRGGLFYGRFI